MEFLKIDTLAEAKAHFMKSENPSGFYFMPDDVYHHPECPGISRSQMQKMRVSPRYFKYMEFAEDKEETEALRFGSMMHLALEDLDEFKRVYQPAPEFKGPRGGKLTGEKLMNAVRTWEAENGCKAICPSERQKIEFMRNSILENKTYQNEFSEALREVAVFAKVPHYNVMLKCKADLMMVKENSILLGDYKSCQLRSLMDERSIMKMIANQNYPLYYQEAFYCYILALLGFQPEFKFIFVEKEAPFGCRAVELDEKFKAFGVDELFGHIDELCYCTINDIWPDYHDIKISLPGYMKRKVLDR